MPRQDDASFNTGGRAQIGRFEAAANHFTCGLAVIRLGKGGESEIQYLSGGLAAICEAEPVPFRRHIQSDLLWGIHAEDREMVAQAIGEMIGSREPREISYRFITEAGKLKWLRVHGESVQNEDGSASLYATYNDITELKKAEHMIDVALANTGVSIWEYDFKRRCIVQYQNSTEMHGFEQIVPEVPWSLVNCGFVHPDSADAFLAMYEKLFAGQPFAEGVFKVQTSDRAGYWYEHIRYTNEFDESGKPYRAVGMSTDETQRQEAIAKYERELEKERGFMADEGLLAHATFDLTTGATLDYRYRDGSELPESERTTFSYAPESAKNIIDEAERARFLALNDRETLLRCFAAGETELRQEYRRRLPDGMVTWVRNTLRLLKDPRSGDLLLFEYWYDIEEEKMQELMYRSIATDNYDFVARIDGRTRHFKSLLREKLTYHMPPSSGDDADAVTYALYDASVPPEDREIAIRNSLVENVRRHLNEQGRFVFTYRVARPDGSLRHKKITQYYIDPQREIIAVMREDITELIREESEKNRALSEALEGANEASRAKSQFLSRVSHELRTPLNAIIGFMELAKDANPEQVQRYLSYSDAAAKQLLSIINDVLDVSSIESGKMKIAHAPFDFKALIKNITDLYEPRCRQKGLRYETSLQTPTDDWLMGDSMRVNQILLNLLNNAFKFTESGSIRLLISQRPIKSDKVMLRFEVADTGCGMSEEMQKRLFKPFEQESAAMAQKYGGSGLGLSIVGSLVGMMNGVVSVKSKQGEGSSFTVDIPFTRSGREAPSVVIDGAEKIRALVVDDEAAAREYMSVVLGRIGVRFSCVGDGNSALAALTGALGENDPFNVCLVDWKMPDMNGLETTRRIRERFGEKLTVIVVSAYDHYQASESAKAAGANLFLSKPLFQSSLFDLFSTITGGRMIRRKAALPQNIDLSHMHIILAEDNAMNQLVAENIIDKKFGARCDCAQNGEIALKLFLDSAPGYYDVILMDIQMPVMDGNEAARRIRASAHPDAREVQIIALTANAFAEDITKSLASGMNAHISKPIEPELLGTTLLQAYAQRREGRK